MTDPAAIAWEVMEYLLARLRDTDLSTVNIAPPETHMAYGALFGFERAGLFDDQQAEEWRDRIQAESNRLLELMSDESQHRMPARMFSPPPLEPSVEEVLTQQLRRLELNRATAERSGTRQLVHLRAAREAAAWLLHALSELHLVDELGERQWQARFNRAADPDAEPLRTYSEEAIAAEVARAKEAEAIPEGEMPLVHPIPDCSLDELVAVFTVRPPADSFARIESIVLYSDGTVITATTPGAEPGQRPPPAASRARLADDVGTYYFSCGGGGGWGGTQRGMHRYTFAPAIPPAASSLHISIGDERFEIQLPHRREHGF